MYVFRHIFMLKSVLQTVLQKDHFIGELVKKQ